MDNNLTIERDYNLDVLAHLKQFNLFMYGGLRVQIFEATPTESYQPQSTKGWAIAE